MTRAQTLSGEQFAALLDRLGPDRDEAGSRYEQLRRRLIAMFTYRGCAQPEDLADETMDRTARKLLEVAPAPGADLSPYIFGVAWNIARESFRRPRTVPLPDHWDLADPSEPTAADDSEQGALTRLERCLRRLPAVDRELVLTYYRAEKRQKIDGRAALAKELKISANALRLRVHRITERLRECMAGVDAAIAGRGNGSMARPGGGERSCV